MDSTSTKIRSKTWMSMLHLFNAVLEVLARAMRQLKETKGIPREKEDTRGSFFFCRWYSCNARKTLKSARQLLQLIRTLVKVAGYKINTRIGAFLYSNAKHTEIRKIYLSKKWEITLTKHAKDLCNKSVKMSRKETKDTRRWKGLPGWWIGRIKVAKWLFHQKQLTEYNPH